MYQTLRKPFHTVFGTHPVHDLLTILFGSLLFSLSMNLLILPTGMYSGGFLGLSQLIGMGLSSLFPAGRGIGNLSGTIYFLLNIPLLVLAFLQFGREFSAKTILCVGCYSLFLWAVPIPEKTLFEDHLSACLIGGLACGAGAAMTLSSGCSGGGEEIAGLLAAKKNPSFSVGSVTMLMNFFVFGIGFFLFPKRIVAYSILFSCVTSLCIDRMHLQNVMVTMMIVTKEAGMEELIFRLAGRGVTKWSGTGAYSNENTFILMTVVSKKEALALKRALREYDQNVFVILYEDVSVIGNFSKRV